MAFLRCSLVLGEVTSGTFHFLYVVLQPGENVINNLFSTSFDRSFKKIGRSVALKQKIADKNAVNYWFP